MSPQNIPRIFSRLLASANAPVELAIAVCAAFGACAKPPTSCFEAGTRIDTPRGPVPIEQLRIGDEIFSYDLRNSTVVLGRVRQTWQHAHGLVGWIRVGGRQLGVTAEHPFYAVDTGSYLPAKQIGGHVTLRLRTSSGGLAKIDQVVIPRAALTFSSAQTVYDISVTPIPNYFAEGVLVHNKSPPRVMVHDGGPDFFASPDLKTAGVPCFAASECQSGYCVDLVCCNAPCDQTCHSCTLSENEGQCIPVPQGQDLRGECWGQTSACNGTCDGSGACEYPGTLGNRCWASCQNNVLWPMVCDGQGRCVADEESSKIDCSPAGCTHPTWQSPAICE